MRMGLRGEAIGVPGFFLMEVVVLIIVFISFSMVVGGWYSSFLSTKTDIMKRGQAIFIASNALELMRMNGKIQDEIDCAPGFRATVSVQKNVWYKNSVSNNFAEVSVCVVFSDRLNPVCLTTGMMLREVSALVSYDSASTMDISLADVPIVANE